VHVAVSSSASANYFGKARNGLRQAAAPQGSAVLFIAVQLSSLCVFASSAAASRSARLVWRFAPQCHGQCAGQLQLWCWAFARRLVLAKLRIEVAQLRLDKEQTQSVLNTSGSLLTAEKAAQEKIIEQVKRLEAENRALRDDLGFFEKLIPTGGHEGLAIRGLQAESVNAGSQLKWQVLVIQPTKNAPAFNGKLEITLSGLQGGAPGTGLGGKPWTQVAGGAAQALQFSQYRRLENVVDLPPQVVVKQVSVKVTEGSATRAVQNVKI
jgi:hypothetical protein